MPSGINICCKLTKTWDPKLANFYKEMYAMQRESVSLSCISYVISYACVWDVWEQYVSGDCLSPPRKPKPKNRMLSRDNGSGVLFSCMSLQQIVMTLLISNYFTWQIEGWSLKFLFEPKLRNYVASVKMSIIAINHCLENNNGTNTVVLSKYPARHWNVKKYR